MIVECFPTTSYITNYKENLLVDTSYGNTFEGLICTKNNSWGCYTVDYNYILCYN